MDSNPQTKLAFHWYPHMEEKWKGFVGLSPQIYPKLFKLNGNQMMTWKEGING